MFKIVDDLSDFVFYEFHQLYSIFLSPTEENLPYPECDGI